MLSSDMKRQDGRLLQQLRTLCKNLAATLSSISLNITNPTFSSHIHAHQLTRCSIPDVRTQVVSGAAGSAYLEHGSTKVFCAIYGPHEGRLSHYGMGELDCEFRWAPSARGTVNSLNQVGCELSNMGKYFVC